VGLFKELCLLPVAPVRGVMWVADRLTDAAEHELYNPAAVRIRLNELNRALEDGEIGLEEFEREEEHLLNLLESGPDAGATRTYTPKGRQA
jgi:Gas vesicle protein G